MKISKAEFEKPFSMILKTAEGFYFLTPPTNLHVFLLIPPSSSSSSDPSHPGPLVHGGRRRISGCVTGLRQWSLVVQCGLSHVMVQHQVGETVFVVFVALVVVVFVHCVSFGGYVIYLRYENSIISKLETLRKLYAIIYKKVFSNL